MSVHTCLQSIMNESGLTRKPYIPKTTHSDNIVDMDIQYCLPAAFKRIIGRRVSVFLGNPVDWASAVALNISKAGQIAIITGSIHGMTICASRSCSSHMINSWFVSACRHGHESIVRVLLALPQHYGVDPSVRDNISLLFAAIHGHDNIVNILLDLPLNRGIDPSINDNEVFRYAACYGHEHIIRILLNLPSNRGVNPSANDDFSLRVAVKNGHDGITQLLCALSY